MEPKVLTTKETGLVIITLNRPDVYNALDQNLLKGLAEHLLDVSPDKCARVRESMEIVAFDRPIASEQALTWRLVKVLKLFDEINLPLDS
ncbi:MAG: hypothetical protein JRI58_09840 [Deltaproteobacteria bacterium]|nr:hypothetical protein [Deltaproteobacteria bacterium]MBW2075032.1 hypothetical protein [Deltaproteobacteria bacterium]RLB84046.1 MAG: hypothetical protein DRH17_00805 [Deltaproteobacteria bacterium]